MSFEGFQCFSFLDPGTGPMNTEALSLLATVYRKVLQTFPVNILVILTQLLLAGSKELQSQIKSISQTLKLSAFILPYSPQYDTSPKRNLNYYPLLPLLF